MWSSAQRFGIWASAVVIATLGITWLYTFALTDYRAHLRPIMIPIGLVTIAYATWLASLNVWAVALQVMLTLLLAIGLISLQIAAAEFHPVLAAELALTLLFLALVGPGLRKQLSQRPPS